MSYELNVSFNAADLKTMYITGTNVVISKSSDGQSTNVAWQVFKPMEKNNVAWEEQYGIYASTAQITNGAKLTKLSCVNDPAAINKLYALNSDATFSGPNDGGNSGSFSVLNNYSYVPYLTIGLFQNANVNGIDVLNNAISAAGVMSHSTAVMTPFTTINIWLQSGVIGNSVVTTVTSPVTQISFGGDTTTQSIIYDSSTGKFIPSASSKEIIKNIRYLDLLL